MDNDRNMQSGTCPPLQVQHVNEKILPYVAKRVQREEIHIFEADCWNCLHDVWFSHATLELYEWLTDVLNDNTEKVYYSCCITMHVMMILQGRKNISDEHHI